MKITGYKLQHRLKEWHHARDIAAALFADSLHRFHGEEKTSPREAFQAYQVAEDAIARLQTAQARYNLDIVVAPLGQEMSLAEAVKRVGGAGRMEKMWRSMAAPKKGGYGYGNDLVRNTDEVRAVRTIPPQEAMDHAKKAARFASALREAIQVANATELESSLDPKLFE